MSTSPSYDPTVAALCFPKITERLQAELDSVVGRDRMPAFDDERSLPLFAAFIKEVTRCVLLLPYFDPIPVPTLAILPIRWRPVVPVGIAHATSKGDVYDGYDIPRGTTVFGNIEYVTISLRASLVQIDAAIDQRARQGPKFVRRPGDVRPFSVPFSAPAGRKLEWQGR
jgi:hypothetical protein